MWYTLYVSSGMSDTWSNQTTPFLLVVIWSLEVLLVPLATNFCSSFVQFNVPETLQQCHPFRHYEDTNIFSCPKNVRKITNVTVAEARLCDPSALVSETVKSVVSGDLAYITRLYVFPSSMFWMLKKVALLKRRKKSKPR